MNRPIYFSDSIIRFALGDPALVGRLLTSVRNADDAMQKGDVEELERVGQNGGNPAPKAHQAPSSQACLGLWHHFGEHQSIFCSEYPPLPY